MDRPETFVKNKVALLADFSEEQPRSLTDCSQIVAANSGNIIAHAGDELHFLGVVLEGKIAASVPSSFGPRALQHISRTINIALKGRAMASLLHGSLKSRLCSCASITLPASS